MKKIIALMLIITLTMIDTLFIGSNLVYAIAENLETVQEKDVEEKQEQSELSKEIYKGYLYQGAKEETWYEEKLVVDVSNLDTSNGIRIKNQQENYVGKQEEKIVYEIKEGILVKETAIKKENFIDLLGEEGEITIKNQQDEEIAKITNKTEVSKNEEFVISYEDKQVSKLTIETTKPLKEGKLVFMNQKTILEKNGYDKVQLKQFQALEETIEINGEITTLTMDLLDTKAEAKIEMSQTNLSTLKRNENIQMTATLMTNKIQYDFYKNPHVEIIFPANLEVEVKSINQINESFMDIKTAQARKNENGETIIDLQLEGEQTEFEETVAEGIQIVMTLDITIDILTPSQTEEITMRYTNENRENEISETKKEITLQSKEGAFLVSRISNYNQSGEVLETTNDKLQIGEIESNSEAKIATEEFYLINNAKDDMSKTTILGRLANEGSYIESENLQVTKQGKLVDFAKVSKEGAKIYYSEDGMAGENSETWKENVEDITNMKAFKIDFGENTISPQEVVKISYQTEIPENLEASQTLVNALNVNYEQEERTMSINSLKALQTPNIVFENIQTQNETKESQEEITVQMAATSEGKALNNGDEIKEGQTIRYTLQITNNKETPINQFKMVATHSNVIYYGVKMIESFDEIEYPHIDEQEDLTNKELTIDTINPGETITLQYQIVASKNVEEGAKTTGEIVFSGEGIEEIRIQAYENPIKQGKLRLKLLCGYAEEQPIYSNHYAYPLELYVENIAGEELTNIDLQLDITEFLGFETINFGYEPKDINCSLSNVVDNKLQFHIEALPMGKEVILYALCYTNPLDVNVENADLNLNFRTTIDGENYTSNELTDKILQGQSKITAIQSGSIEGEYVKNEDSLIYTTKIKNEGVIDFQADISDTLPRGVNIKEAYLIRDGKRQEITNIIYQTILESRVLLKPNEEVTFVVETTIDASIVDEDTITNVVDVSGFESNEISYRVKKEIPENPDDPNKPENPDDPNNPTGEIKKAIYGMAWVDENSDGIKDNSERKIANMEVYLFNQQDGTPVAKTITSENGNYSFENIAQGKYLVVFNYDNTKYKVTQYQKEGVNSSKNSDVIEKEIRLDGQIKKVAITEGLELSDINLLNIDAGFIQEKVFDLKLDKYIHKVTIQSKKGTTVREYGKTQFAKVELSSRTIADSTILIEYQIEVKNEGEVSGYVTEIMDDIPKDLVFSEKNNKNWYKTEDGKLITKELANQIINPDETKTVTLILSKTMNQNNTGTSINTAEITEQSNELAIKDENKKNDKSTAELIISIATGEIIWKVTVFTIIIISILGVGIYWINKKVLKTK